MHTLPYRYWNYILCDIFPISCSVSANLISFHPVYQIGTLAALPSLIHLTASQMKPNKARSIQMPTADSTELQTSRSDSHRSTLRYAALLLHISYQITGHMPPSSQYSAQTQRLINWIHQHVLSRADECMNKGTGVKNAWRGVFQWGKRNKLRGEPIGKAAKCRGII